MDAAALIRQGYEAFNRGDVEGTLVLAHPDGEVHPSGAFPDVASIYKGREGFAQFIRDIRSAWEQVAVEPVEILARGDRVLVLLRLNGSGRDGIEVTAELSHLFTLRDGLGWRLVGYASWDEGRAALASA